jgi:flavin-dependent thymidylate synthase
VALADQHKVKLDWITPEPEKVLARHARVSTKNPDRSEYLGLLKYCLREGHVSVFEQVCASFEIITTRSISPQILRHRSFCFQETSQRYCDPIEILESEASYMADFDLRGQDSKNRQNSIIYSDRSIEKRFRPRIHALFAEMDILYHELLDSGVARECARNILPLGVPTRLHMQGNLRNWLFYVGLRSAPGTQLEHKFLSNLIGRELQLQMPDLIEAVIEAAKENDSLGLKGWKFIHLL